MQVLCRSDHPKMRLARQMFDSGLGGGIRGISIRAMMHCKVFYFNTILCKSIDIMECFC